MIAEDLDGKLESRNTYVITCLARTASFNAVRQPDTGQMVDLSHYYGAWVTPHVEIVQARFAEPSSWLQTGGWKVIRATPTRSRPRSRASISRCVKPRSSMSTR